VLFLKGKMLNDNWTDKFIDELYELTQTSIPESVILQARRCLLDYLGVTLSGAKMLEKKVVRFFDFFEPVPGNSTVIGFERKANLQNAVLMNGLCAHVAELDDGERVGMMHPGAPVISAVLSLAEQENISGEKLLMGIVVGYEAALRVAGAIQPSTKDRGYHATGTCGTIGAAMGIAAILGFSKTQMKDALSAAATGASGILTVIHGESELKPFNAGQAALSGLLAAFVARAGFKGPADVLGGKRGFFAVMADQVDPSRLEKTLESRFAIENIYVKPYAACRHCHSAIDAVLKIRFEHDVKLEDVEKIKVRTYWWAVGGHEHTKIEGGSSAKMSIPYSVSVAFVTGKAGLNEFLPQWVGNVQVLSLAQKVEVCSDEELTLLVPKNRAAIVEITTHDNRCYTARVDLPKGEPETALTEKELTDKFMVLGRFGGLPAARADQIIQCVFDTTLDAKKLMDLLRV